MRREIPKNPSINDEPHVEVSHRVARGGAESSIGKEGQTGSKTGRRTPTRPKQMNKVGEGFRSRPRAAPGIRWFVRPGGEPSIKTRQVVQFMIRITRPDTDWSHNDEREAKEDHEDCCI